MDSYCEICKTDIEILEKRNCNDCSFIACKRCIETWFNTSLECPQCRKEESWENVEYNFTPSYEISAELIQRIGSVIDEHQDELRNATDFNELMEILVQLVGEELADELAGGLVDINMPNMTIFVQQQPRRRQSFHRRILDRFSRFNRFSRWRN